jgi:hypothetical protein
VRRRRALRGALVLLGATAVAGELAGPRIRVEPTIFDFGKVRPQRTLRKEFRVRNLGDRPLAIGRISKSCRCTGAMVDETAVAPGDSTSLRVWLETRNASGPIEEQVLLNSNDPETPQLKIRLRATVVAE